MGNGSEKYDRSVHLHKNTMGKYHFLQERAKGGGLSLAAK
jgi:hypothetical protein